MKYTLSYWEKEFSRTERDIIIIGGGIVGLQTAINIKAFSPKLDVLVVDKGQGKFSASTKNAGFACFGSPTELLADIETVGPETAMNTVHQRWKGLQRMKDTLPAASICFQQHGGYEIFLKGEEQIYQKVLDKVDFLNAEIQQVTGLATTFSPDDGQLSQMGFQDVPYLIYNPYEGQLHPALMIQGLTAKALAAGVTIANGVSIKQILPLEQKVELIDNEGNKLKATSVVVATNGFTQQLFPQLDLYPVRNQVLITEEIHSLPFKGTFHYHEGYVYFRNVGKRVLIGGGRHLDKEGEQTDSFGEHHDILIYLENFLANHLLPEQPIRIHHKWSGILGMGKEKEPLLEFVYPNVLAAVRLGGMGVALGWEVGSKAASLIVERH
ncbi:MAG: FAD-dependent oxidoreductase [Bacteroidota bacterium]